MRDRHATHRLNVAVRWCVILVATNVGLALPMEGPVNRVRIVAVEVEALPFRFAWIERVSHVSEKRRNARKRQIVAGASTVKTINVNSVLA